MKNKLIKFMVGTMIMGTFSITAFADWHSSQITLPRTGSWKTILRDSSGPEQQTRVLNNHYDVLGRIVLSNNDALSSYQTHEDLFNSHYGEEKYHKTKIVSGTPIKAEFKTTTTNYKTTTAMLKWRP